VLANIGSQTGLGLFAVWLGGAAAHAFGGRI
jgi:hypothetical protein